MADLITLEYLKTALGVAHTNNDDKYEQAIAEASQAIRSYTERDFNPTPVTEARVFDYDGSGYLDIDDATEITQVELIGQGGADDYTLEAEQWRAAPTRRLDAPVYYYLVLPGYGENFYASAEMGFTRNLDVLAREGRFPGFMPQFRVTATWGWPEIPADVMRAALWTALSMHENPQPYISESIEGYSRSIGPAPQDSIPNRAQALLTPYLRLKV